MEEKHYREERTAKSQFEHMMKLEDKIKELKVQNQIFLNGQQNVPGDAELESTIRDLKSKLA